LGKPHAQITSVFNSFKTVGYSAGVLRQKRLEIMNHGLTRKVKGVLPDPHSIFEIGSLTKVFTALLLYDLQEHRILNLHDPVNDHLPKKARLPSWEGKEITLLHLATHTSGLPRMPSRHFIRPDDGQHPFSHLSADDAYRFLQEVKLEFPPGSKYLYSNLGYGLLGHLLQLATGRSFQELVRTVICEPLEMRDTTIALNEEQTKRFCHGYSMRGAPRTHLKLDFLAPAGGLRSTVDDLTKLPTQVIDHPGSRLSRQLRACQIIRHKWPDDSVERARSRLGLNTLRAAGVGLGWHVYSLRDGGDLAWHSGGTRGFSSFVGLARESRAGVVFLANSNGETTGLGIKALMLATS
jgi:CubicO group peptidase (beta-lactamase class C family)